jgi:Zn finger protein HypA/HybF involved in hydrogenase expression
METIKNEIIKLGQKFWDVKDNVKLTKLCKQCSEEWFARAIGNDGLCPHCREGIKPKYSTAIEYLYLKFVEFGYDTKKLLEEVDKMIKDNAFSDETLLLKCLECHEYVTVLYETEYGVCCKKCYDIKKYYAKKDDKEKNTREARE